MTLYWWTCPWCFDRMATRHDEDTVRQDQGAHLRTTHPQIVPNDPEWPAAMTYISHYDGFEAHP